MGSDLYNKLSEYLKGHLTKLRKVRFPDAFISFIEMIVN